jgi:pimeloyl-ACP methyl ester carboxylesterase
MALYLFTLATMAYLFLVGGRRKRLKVGRISLAYYTLGPKDGEPWLLLHGLGSVAATWSPVLRSLRGECRLIVPELSELGGSKVPDGGLGVRSGVDVVACLIEEELGGRPITVAGLSLGGWLAVRLTLRRPDLVSRLVLIDCGGYRHQDWEAIGKLVRVQGMDDIDTLYKALFVKVPWAMGVSRRGFLQAYSSRAVTGVLDGLSEEDTFDDDDLREIRVPTGLIWGERDGVFKLDCARAMAAALPDARLEVLTGCGHAVHMECPRRLAGAVQRFRRATAGVESRDTFAEREPCRAPTT